MADPPLRPPPLEEQRRYRQQQQLKQPTVAENWVAQLRRQAPNEPSPSPPLAATAPSGGRAGNRQPRYNTRPTSSTSSLRPLSSSPSLLSLETPASPTTTVGGQQPFPSSSGSHQQAQHRHSAAPHPNYPSTQHQSHLAQHPARSHSSLPALPSNGDPPRQHRERAGARHNHHHHHHHPREPIERSYGPDHARYDAEFDRGTAAPAAASSSSARAGPSSSNASRLFNPDAAGGGGERRTRERELREDGTVRRPRSKREVVDLIDLGRRATEKDSRESLESEESGASGRPGSRSSKDGRPRRSRREEVGRRREDDSTGTLAGASSAAGSSSRQLFDPRRDDPVKFAGKTSRKGGPTAADSRSLISSTVSLGSAASVSDASVNQEVDSVATGASGANGARRPEGDQNPVMTQLRRAYREIADLETKLQDENKAAMAAASRDDDAGQGLRIQGGGRKYDDEYWVKLATGHKNLADAHYSFLQLALDPRLPASLHSLPQRYNIPTRLWQTGFHQLLERMRHAIVSAPPPSPHDSIPPTNVLEHLIEFIQYAYGHYTQLFEDQAVAVFRPAWIEQLGDLARYRMAVAGLASRVSAASQPTPSNNGPLALSSSPERQPRSAEAASIGVPALNDWDLEEQDTWREMARDWYGQGVTETPGTGRLQHHLALLSKGDELKGLYHYAKSLTAAHPYLSARESILPLFEDEHQARRTQPDVTKAELFVHLHGMLFTKIALDDFDECLARFVERITEEGLLAERLGGDWEALGSGPTAPFGDAEWFMLAVINISALLQYGADDAVLKKATTKEGAHPASKPTTTTTTQKGKTPQAIMLNPSSLKRSELDDDDLLNGDDPLADPSATSTTEFVMPLNSSTSSSSKDPLVFRLAQRLTFTLLDFVLQHPTRRVGDSDVVNPYITLVLTFLANLSHQPKAMKHLERAVPWDRIATFLNKIPSGVEVRMDVQSKLVGVPLPEDWCIRGMDWTGKHLFGRGYWRSKTGGRRGGGPGDDMAPPPINGLGSSSSTSIESEMDALKLDLNTLDEFADGEADGANAPSAQLAVARWRRMATLGAWLARNVAGLDLSRDGRFIVGGSLKERIARWKREDDEEAEAERKSRMSAWEKNGTTVEEEEEMSEEDEDEDDDDENDSPAVRELKSRRRQLKAVIKQARLATRGASQSIRHLSSSKRHKLKQAREQLKVFPGFTVLVFDTNVLLSSMKLLRDLVEAECWTIIVPLAVITELDGLKRNAAPLGASASEAVEYLETAIRTHARYLKVQTSRGNYLRDLSIRSESIDFSGNAELDASNLAGGVGGQGFSHDFARNMDDVILRALSWQSEHFTSRLALVNPAADRRTVPNDTSKVVLVTFDRNLRLKARARGLDAVDEHGMAMLLETKDNG